MRALRVLGQGEGVGQQGLGVSAGSFWKGRSDAAQSLAHRCALQRRYMGVGHRQTHVRGQTLRHKQKDAVVRANTESTPHVHPGVSVLQPAAAPPSLDATCLTDCPRAGHALQRGMNSPWNERPDCWNNTTTAYCPNTGANPHNCKCTQPDDRDYCVQLTSTARSRGFPVSLEHQDLLLAGGSKPFGLRRVYSGTQLCYSQHQQKLPVPHVCICSTSWTPLFQWPLG